MALMRFETSPIAVDSNTAYLCGAINKPSERMETEIRIPLRRLRRLLLPPSVSCREMPTEV